jgi:hypothetical protein
MAGIVKNKHIVQIGITPSFLIGSKINYQSTTNEQVIISSSLYGYTKGLINLGIKPSIGYMYSITPTIQVGGNIQIQLISAIEKNRFEGSITNKPISGQFFIRKSLFLK